MTMTFRRTRAAMPADIRARVERSNQRVDIDVDKFARRLREQLDPGRPQPPRVHLPAPARKYRGRVTLALVAVLLVANYLAALRAIR